MTGSGDKRASEGETSSRKVKARTKAKVQSSTDTASTPSTPLPPTPAAAPAASSVTTLGHAPPPEPEETVVRAEVMKPPTEEQMPHLCCTVCMSFPEAHVLQCGSGHILCNLCHERILHEEKPICPTCRMPLDALKPIRNVLAEQTISLLPVSCPHEACRTTLTRGVLAQHVTAECRFRSMHCKYSPLGCKWEGMAKELVHHEEHCKRAEQPGWRLLKKVCAKVSEDATVHRAALATANEGMRVCELLSGRCKNISISHVTLHKCSAHEHAGGKPAHMVSPSFHAIGFRWKVYTISDLGTGKYSVVLQLRDCRMPLPVDFFVIRSPGMDASIRPASLSHTFAPRHRSTELLCLAEGSVADVLGDADTISLRIGIVDRRTGRLNRSFQGQGSSSAYAGPGGHEEDEWGDSMYGSDENEEGEESEADMEGGSADDEAADMTHGGVGPWSSHGVRFRQLGPPPGLVPGHPFHGYYP